MTNCRTCTSERLQLFLPLGSHPLANGFLRQDQLAKPEPTFPLDVYVCLDCGLIQVADNVPPGFFRNYVYIPSASDVMRDHFDGLAGAVHDRFLSGTDGLTIDIGCNDGILLESLNRRGARTLGVDPAENIAELARERGVEVLTEYLTTDFAARVREERGPASVVLTTNTFHHVDDLGEFTEAVRVLLADDGVFIVEVPHALQLVEDSQFDGVYHEHVSQLTVKSFVDLFRRFGMQVFDVERLGVHGGSIRVFARAGEGVPTNVQEWIDEETRSGLFEPDTYDAFRERVERRRTQLLELLGGLKSDGKRLAGYGASARGNTLLNYYGIGPDVLDYIADRNPLKHGLYSPGMHIEVRDADAIASDPPAYLLLIAWNFADEIMRQQSAYAEAGGKFILPIPEVMVSDGVAAVS